jgi:hypothetical protein
MDFGEETKQVEALEALAAQLKAAGYEVKIFKESHWRELYGTKKNTLTLDINASKELPVD